MIFSTALLSPRDESEIISHLRMLSGVEHVQTHTIPQLSSSTQDGEESALGGGLFGRLRRKRQPDRWGAMRRIRRRNRDLHRACRGDEDARRRDAGGRRPEESTQAVAPR